MFLCLVAYCILDSDGSGNCRGLDCAGATGEPAKLVVLTGRAGDFMTVCNFGIPLECRQVFDRQLGLEA